MLKIRETKWSDTGELFYLFQCSDQRDDPVLRLSPKPSSSDCRNNPQTATVSTKLQPATVSTKLQPATVSTKLHIALSSYLPLPYILLSNQPYHSCVYLPSAGIKGV